MKTAVVLLAATLAGCASTPPPAVDSTWLDRVEVRPAVTPSADGRANLCDELAALAAEIERGRALGVPRSAMLRTLDRADPSIRPIVRVMIEGCYDNPAFHGRPETFAAANREICLELVQ